MSRALAQLGLLLSPWLVLQLGRTLAEVLDLRAWGPDLVLLGATLVALRAAPLAACAWAAAAGFLRDVPEATRLGLVPARVSLLVLVLGALRGPLALDGPLACALAAPGLVLADRALATLAVGLSGEEVAVLPLLEHGALVALATALVAPFAWSLVRCLEQAIRPERPGS